MLGTSGFGLVVTRKECKSGSRQCKLMGAVLRRQAESLAGCFRPCKSKSENNGKWQLVSVLVVGSRVPKVGSRQVKYLLRMRSLYKVMSQVPSNNRAWYFVVVVLLLPL